MTDKNHPTAGQGGGAQDNKSSQHANGRSEPDKEQAKSTAQLLPLIHPNFDNIFRDPRSWRPYRLDITAPHRMYVGHNADGKVAIVVSLRTREEGDWSIGKAALEYIVAAERDKRIAEGHFILIDNKRTVVAAARASEVMARIGNTPPNAGDWGEFWWVDSTFKPTAGYRGRGNDETPF